MEHGPIYMPGDKVFYVGDKFKMELTSKEGKPHAGWIHAAVVNEPGKFVVWFPDTKDSDSYVMGTAVISKAKPSKAERQQQHAGPEIMPRRKKKEDE